MKHKLIKSKVRRVFKSIMNNKWTNNLTDKDYRYISKEKIYRKCTECGDLTSNGYCSNIYSYPTMPEGFGCKNSRSKEVIDDIIIKENGISKFFRNLINLINLMK